MLEFWSAGTVYLGGLGLMVEATGFDDWGGFKREMDRIRGNARRSRRWRKRTRAAWRGDRRAIEDRVGQLEMG